MVDVEMSDSEIDPVVTDIDTVVMDIDPLVQDTGPVDMDAAPVFTYHGHNLGVEDYGRLISLGVPSCKFNSSKYMTSAGDQFPLDSCVSHTLSATLGALVGLTYDHEHIAPEFSTQEMIDCLPIKYGGVSYEAGYGYVMKNGLHMDTDYPSQQMYGLPCRCSELQGRIKYSFKEYTYFAPEVAPMILQSHPLTAGMHVYKSFGDYRTPYVSPDDLMRIYRPLEGEQPVCLKGRALKHAILVLGHGVLDNEHFYIIKNSSGVSWGVNGYALVAAKLLFDFAFPSTLKIIQ